jgi:hypothetical protein
MDRRSLLQCFGTLVFGMMNRSTMSPGYLIAQPPSPIQHGHPHTRPGESTLPSSVAGVTIVDSKIAKAATDLCRTVSPPYLFHHAMRTFLFGSLVGRALGKPFDEEIFYLACILHDLGLTDKFAGDLPFEIQGAEAARRFLDEQSYAKDHTEIVWDGIAMHCLSIGGYKRPEIALVGEGAGADVLGPDPVHVKKSDIAAILEAFPRLKFKDAFVKTCADVVQHHPRSAGRTFMRDIAERRVPAFHPPNFCDLVASAPFDE